MKGDLEMEEGHLRYFNSKFAENRLFYSHSFTKMIL